MPCDDRARTPLPRRLVSCVVSIAAVSRSRARRGPARRSRRPHAIVDLIVAGKRVGITANSHAVITNLLDEVMRAAAKRKVVITAMQRIDGAGCAHPDVTAVNDSKTVESALAAGEVQLVAGTAWLFARPGMEESLDHLFVDEAGQMSLANVVAVGTADAQPRARRRSAATQPALHGHASGGRGRRRARAPPRRSGHRAAGREVCSSRRRTGCTRTSRRSCRSCRTRTACSRSTHAVGNGS